MKPKAKINTPIIEYFNHALTDLPFPKFFSLFRRYSPEWYSKDDWQLYKVIILQPTFLQGVSQHYPSFVYNIWGLLEDDIEFKLIFNSFLSNSKSAYYTELKSNDGSDTVLGHLPFLQSVLVRSLMQNHKNGLQFLLSDFSKKQIRVEREKPNSILAQPHHYYHTKGEEGYDLAPYFHIRFIGLMYSTAITNKIDIHPHMHTLYAGMIEEIVKNLTEEDLNKPGEYPTNYHWLINEIFYCTKIWMEYFGGKHIIPDDRALPESGHIYFSSSSTYIDFIPSCQNFYCQAIYKGVEEGIISIRFLRYLMHYHIFSQYFQWDLKEEMRTSIESNIIKSIPKAYIPDILDFTLDERYTGGFNEFVQKKFRGSKSEIALQLRLWNYLEKERLIDSKYYGKSNTIHF